MKLGSRGVQVAELQADLFRAGHDTGGADGVFGPLTDRAVRAFQQKYGLTVDGVAGPVTLAKLTEVITVEPRQAQDRKMTEHFSERELACSHCGRIYIHTGLVNKLQELRNETGRLITITSGYRCPVHNMNIGGAKQSRHMLGQAADIVIQGMTPDQVAHVAEHIGFGGIGVYKSGFTHVDVGPKRKWQG